VTGRELVLDALANKQTSRAPWVPFVGVHGGALLGKTADRYLRSPDLVVAGVRKAAEHYRADGVPVVFDLQMEAEVLGCELRWGQDVPPSVATHPLEGSRTLASLPRFDVTKGRLPIAFEATRRLRGELGHSVALYGLICGPFTLALHLAGNGIFLEMYDDPDGVGRLVSHCAGVAATMSEEYVRAGADVIGVVDPMVSQISPEHFDAFVTPNLNCLLDTVRSAGAASSIFVCGDSTRVLERLFSTHCDNVSIDENVSLEGAREAARRHGKSFGGNLRLTTVLLLGDENATRANAVECVDLGGNRGYVLSPGYDLPYGVPPANLAAVAGIARDAYSREVARSCSATDSGQRFDDVVVPDYENKPNVIVDVITLDSSSCAPCQYMVDAAGRAAAWFEGRTVVREHKIKERDGLGYMAKLGVKHIPTICIDGRVAFSSIIPDCQTLVGAIGERMAKRGRP
jgi:uroporphyrinogen decarboxylase